MMILPSPNPCGSCPYRRDVPSGVWARSEYKKLPEYDKPTWEQPPAVFMCHQQDGRPCAGWVAVHDMQESLALRFALATNQITEEGADALTDYKTDTPLFRSGAEAARHGMREIRKPGAKAVAMVTHLTQKRRKLK